MEGLGDLRGRRVGYKYVDGSDVDYGCIFYRLGGVFGGLDCVRSVDICG